MELINHTDFLLDSYEYLDRNGMEYALILLRAHYKLKKVDDNSDIDWILIPHEDQGELLDKDVHYDDDDPNASILLEKDYVDFKLTTDIIINGYTYPPKDELMSTWLTGIKIGDYEKLLRIYGPRSWIKTNNGWTLTEPTPCDKVALRYENAYGGTPHKNIDNELTCSNPVGKGVFDINTSENRVPAHQIEHPEEQVNNCNEYHYPQGFGFFNREWEPRKSLQGEDPSFVSEDFPPIQAKDVIANQAAPMGVMPTEFLLGNETIVLVNLLNGKSHQKIKLPGSVPFMSSETISGKQKCSYLPLDTVVLNFMEEEDYHVFFHWRLLHANPAEIETISVILKEEEQ